jgi:Na+/H+-dicarboxylate symporter
MVLSGELDVTAAKWLLDGVCFVVSAIWGILPTVISNFMKFEIIVIRNTSIFSISLAFSTASSED